MDTSSDAEKAAGQSPNESCPICKGAGFVHPRSASGKPDYSRIVPCRCTKDVLDKEREGRLRVYSNIGALSRFTFDNLAPQGRSGMPANQKLFSQAYQAARAFAADPRGWLVLLGHSGSGKTHLAAAVANERLKRGYPVFFQTVPDLLDHLRSAFVPGSEMPYDELFERLRSAPLLVLDDLGVEASTPWAKEKLDQLLNHRFNHELPTIITTGVPIEEMDERLRTRLTDPRLSQIFLLEGKSSSLPEYSWGPEFELQRGMTFKNFDWKRVNLSPEQRQNLEAAYRLALDFAESPDGWLVLVGDNGCGKTHLAAAIVNYRYEAKKTALFVLVPEFLDHLRRTFSPESKVSYDQLFERVKNAPFLVLDGFGEQSTTPWAQEKLYQLINYRYNARMSTVITTTLMLDEIEDRISFRLGDPKISTVFNIIAPGYFSSSRKPDTQSKNTPRRPKKSRWE